jgi:hypothetical protein
VTGVHTCFLLDNLRFGVASPHLYMGRFFRQSTTDRLRIFIGVHIYTWYWRKGKRVGLGLDFNVDHDYWIFILYKTLILPSKTLDRMISACM